MRRHRRVARTDGRQARRADRALPRPPAQLSAQAPHLGPLRHPRQPQEAAQVLGARSTQSKKSLPASFTARAKKLSITTLLPKDIERFPWAGHLGTRLVRQVAQQVDKHNSTLLFTNTRSQTEIWFQELSAARPKWGDTLAMHHGSLDREVRDEVEQGLRDGQTSSAWSALPPSTLASTSPPSISSVQVGSPKGIARPHATRRPLRSRPRPNLQAHLRPHQRA